jgi:hypothetical protein
MKWTILPFILLFVYTLTTAQVSNIRSGNWSDPTLWSNVQVPNGADSVTLEFDMVIDENAACKFLRTNGHTVTVNTGVDFGVGKPMLARDTATLLTITTTAKFNGGATDSVKRVLKNSYVNGVKRIVGIEDHGGSGKAYTVFTYNNQNQLVSLVYYNHDRSGNTSRTSITWTNNRVSKLVTTGSGQKPRVQSISYLANGANTDVVVNQVDTVLDSRTNNIVSIKTQQKVLTVSPSFTPMSKDIYGYTFYPDGSEKFDTANSVYQYDAKGNLSGLWEASSQAFNSIYQAPQRDTDTTTRSLVRDNPDSASMYRFLLDIYGYELLTLVDYHLLSLNVPNLVSLEVRDVTGYIYHPLIADGEYRQQTVSSMIVSRRRYSNGNLVSNTGPEQQYEAVIQFDNRHRLVTSIFENARFPVGIFYMRLEYPD